MANGAPDYPFSFLVLDDPQGAQDGDSGILVNPANAQFYRVTVAAVINNVSGSTIHLDVKIQWTQNGSTNEAIVCSADSSTAGTVALGGSLGFFPDQGTIVFFFANPTGTSTGDKIPLHIRTEGME